MQAVVSSAAPAPIEFEFVIGNNPDQLKGGSSKRLRSYLSKRSWQAHLQQREKREQKLQHLQHQHRQPQKQQQQLASSSSPSSSSSSTPPDSAAKTDEESRQAQLPAGQEDRSKKKRRQRRKNAVTFELEVRPRGLTSQDQLQATGQALGQLIGMDPLQLLSMDFQLGGGRVDPFKSYPGPWQAYTPHLVDHYIMHMAVDIPELDQPGGKGLLRSHWFRLAVSEVSTFQVVLLLSAANFVSIKGGVASEMGFQMHQLKHDAITSINAAFRDDDKRLSDSIIGAVAKMASFEAMHGDAVTFALHMEAVCRMVRMRGGLYSLGLAGLLRRMLIWIDLNGGFLLQTPRYFPGQTFGGNEAEVPEPNPARFIAI